MSEPSHGRAVAPRATRKTSAAPSGFDFTSHMNRLCRDMTERLPQLRHIDLDHLAIAFAQARKRTQYGLHASLTPMRFEGGQLGGVSQGRRYRVGQLFDEHGREILYILTFYLPRFVDLGFREKLITILHELWHVGPDFDGDLRRHEGRCYAHTHSQKQYDGHMSQLAAQWLAASPPVDLYQFLDFDFQELKQRFGRVYGVKVRRPRLIPTD